MARTSPSALMEHILPKMMEFYRGRPAIYQQVDDRENNNYSYNNNNITEDDREVGLFNSGRPGMKVWQMITKNIMGINCLYSHAQRKSGFLPISSEVELAEVGVVRVALVSMGEHIGLLDNWYTQPDEGNKVPLNSILFPISTYLINVLKKIKLDMNEIGSWWFSLEMRKLRLRQNIKALYLFDLVTEEQMLLYKRGKVSMQDEYILTTTIDSRIEVWIL